MSDDLDRLLERITVYQKRKARRNTRHPQMEGLIDDLLAERDRLIERVRLAETRVKEADEQVRAWIETSEGWRERAEKAEARLRAAEEVVEAGRSLRDLWEGMNLVREYQDLLDALRHYDQEREKS